MLTTLGTARRAAALAAALLALAAPAQAPSAQVPRPAPAAAPAALSCPAGTAQVGGPNSEYEAVLCLRVQGGARVFHGPYVAFWPNGVRQAQGQYEGGLRAGRWLFFDQTGALVGETSFKDGSYDGLRLERYADGRPRLEERYVAGKRQGTQRRWDEAGRVTSVEFRDDRPVP